jgi:uncharacterized protein (DUF1778 family)
MKTPKLKIRTYRCTTDLDALLVKAANAVRADTSQFLRDIVRQGSETVLNDPTLQEQLQHKYALAWGAAVTKLPKPIPKQNYLRSLADLEKQYEHVDTLSKAFEDKVSSIYDLSLMTAEEVLQLKTSLGKSTGKGRVLVVQLGR